MKIKSPFLNFFLILIGIIAAFVALECLLRTGEYFVSRKKPQSRVGSGGELILFAGDSWTYGVEVSPGESFYSLINKEKIFDDFQLDNIAYPSSNYFQIVNSVLEYRKIPNILILTGGINAWHLIGISEFMEHAESYLKPDEYEKMRQVFKEEREGWTEKLKIHKLYLYLKNSLERKKKSKTMKFDYRSLDQQLKNDVYRDLLIEFQNEYPEYEDKFKKLSGFLKENQTLTLDQKFYFAISQIGFYTDMLEKILKEADLFYPERLSVFSYDDFKSRDPRARGLFGRHDLLVEASFEVLSRWAEENNVTVVVQTYPDVFNGNREWFVELNEAILQFGQLHKFEIIDHNKNFRNWKKHEKNLHVDREGHFLMKENIVEWFLDRRGSHQKTG